ncbi:MAG: hypothetical protein GY938_13560 [Ketobacter sp.]|nr:hypothetical protein [Ketobacter sp.]
MSLFQGVSKDAGWPRFGVGTAPFDTPSFLGLLRMLATIPLILGGLFFRECLNRYVATLQPVLQETMNNSVGMSWRLDAKTSAPLYIQTLGPFRVWRQGQEIPPTAWRRDKALRLFQLLVTRRHTRSLLHRERILGILWPDTVPGVGCQRPTGCPQCLAPKLES